MNERDSITETTALVPLALCILLFLSALLVIYGLLSPYVLLSFWVLLYLSFCWICLRYYWSDPVDDCLWRREEICGRCGNLYLDSNGQYSVGPCCQCLRNSLLCFGNEDVELRVPRESQQELTQVLPHEQTWNGGSNLEGRRVHFVENINRETLLAFDHPPPPPYEEKEIPRRPKPAVTIGGDN